MPRLAASRNRSLDTQPATARCRASPPLNPRPPPPDAAGLSTTSVNGPAAPSAVTAPSTFLTSTSKLMVPHRLTGHGRACRERAYAVRLSAVFGGATDGDPPR